MSRNIRNIKKTLRKSELSGLIYLCDIPDRQIFVYPQMNRAYIATGRKMGNRFEAVCIGSQDWNHEELCKRTWLSKGGRKQSRVLNEFNWEYTNLNKWDRERVNLDLYTLNPNNILEIWMSHIDLREADPRKKRSKNRYITYKKAMRGARAKKDNDLATLHGLYRVRY